MKKLLSLLSVLTISGAAVPTTIAASPYQKEEIINSDINYQQTNNLETLKRHKRDLILNEFIYDKGYDKNLSYTYTIVHVLMKPNFWEEIYELCKKFKTEEIKDFTDQFYNKIQQGDFRFDSMIQEHDFIRSIAWIIHNHHRDIQDVFNSSSKTKQIKFSILLKRTGYEIWKKDIHIISSIHEEARKEYFNNLLISINNSQNSQFKKIKSVNIDNLNFSNVDVTRNSDLKIIYNFNDICFEKKIFINDSLKDIKSQKIQTCDYDLKSKLTFEFTTELNKEKQTNKLINWNINLNDENKLEDFINLNNRHSKIMVTLSENFDLFNIKNIQQKEKILQTFNKTEKELSINPETKLEVTYRNRETNLESILNLKQKITGKIDIQYIDNNDQEKQITFSIKEAIEILKNNSILPNEISISEDNNSIIFNRKAKINYIKSSKPKLNEKVISI